MDDVVVWADLYRPESESERLEREAWERGPHPWDDPRPLHVED